eukprot:865048-Amphidinium_carterae.2
MVVLILTDCRRISSLGFFVLSEILWVASHYFCSCLKRRLRKCALRIRPYAVASTETGEVIDMSPLRPRPSTAMRSLADIQLEVAGGYLRSAVRCKRMRFERHKKLCLVVQYSPQRAGDCLFSAVSRACLQVHGHAYSAKQVRHLLWSLLKRLPREDLGAVSARFGMSVEDYVQSAKSTRWGTSFDLRVLVEEMELPAILYNRHTGRILVEHGRCQDRVIFGFKNSHFTICRWQRDSAQGMSRIRKCSHTDAFRHVSGGMQRGAGEGVLRPIQSIGR